MNAGPAELWRDLGRGLLTLVSWPLIFFVTVPAPALVTMNSERGP
jgi:hypothetical protein